ncbi:NAD(P)/FAD-dependent oxidoreductase [Paraburkholderia tropica]|uniref:NAD(P)/FAD-dependent oxidoreductase n=1 Tax=Paraburkholderia tropica TaxID=92647 RepID=UPI00159035AF|nr:FAD-dependent oxidoreductase [Paraburkholderia tropica]
MKPGILIVGAGQAGAEVACALRDRGYTESISIVGEEAYAPYQRPPLSKAYLAGKADAQTLALRSDEFFERAQIALVKSQRVVNVALADGGEGGEATTDTGHKIAFERLILAVGASPRRMSVPGSELAGIHYLRDIRDAEALKVGLERAQSVVVVGGGFIGLEAAAVARARGKAVTLIEGGPRVIGRVVAPVVSEFYLKAHQRRGTEIRLNAAVTGFDGENGVVTAVRLADGSSINADLVVVGIGVQPRLELAEQLRLRCEGGGIWVDEFARTSHPSVFAIGDCTVSPHPLALGRHVRLESVPHATEQAKTAAATIMGNAEPYVAVPWFWSDQDSMKLQIAGLSHGFDQTVMRGNPDAERFAVYYFRDGKFLAVDAVNSPRDFMAGRRALTSGKEFSPADVAA